MAENKPPKYKRAPSFDRYGKRSKEYIGYISGYRAYWCRKIISYVPYDIKPYHKILIEHLVDAMFMYDRHMDAMVKYDLMRAEPDSDVAKAAREVSAQWLKFRSAITQILRELKLTPASTAAVMDPETRRDAFRMFADIRRGLIEKIEPTVIEIPVLESESESSDKDDDKDKDDE